MADEVEQKVVTAVGSLVLGSDAGLTAAVEKAMSDAVLECNAEGISTEEKNTPVIRERMRVARERVIAEWEGRSNG